MGESIRINTQLGINKTINVKLEQDFDFLEILSLKIQQENVYTRSCSNYGVIVGRVTANNGLGIPNAKVSVFIPISSIDESNPIIQSIYPYKSPSDKNEDGYRYNLLPYEKSYSKHAATGTFPSKSDILTGDTTAIEIYEKYYKYVVRTNDSGDYMIMGAPIGQQNLVMDVDLSDIGEFSLTPQDLIRMGIATESQVAGGQFRTSTDLNSLPQIISINKTLEVSPLWGDPEICQIAINRVDFDLRDDANVDIQPTAVFMGSIYSASDKFRVRKNCRPRDNLGNLCDLSTSPGQILAIRQTIYQDSDGNPILEEHKMEQSGNVIDADGTWMVELPMNLDYVTTNQFGEKIISNDPTIGVPTRSRYRFKIKWQQPNTLNIQTRRAYFLVPNVREYGWSGSLDPNYLASGSTQNKMQKSSYYFGLDWSGYTEGFSGQAKINKLNDSINCEDTFYEFKYNRVYTVAGLIDQYKKGARGRFIGIKEIDDDSCSSTNNKFPVNEGFKNFDFLYFLFSIIFQIFQVFGLFILIIAHIVLFIYKIVSQIVCSICDLRIGAWRPFKNLGFCKSKFCNSYDFRVRLPMMTYPECQSCECKQDVSQGGLDEIGSTTGQLTYVSSPDFYFSAIESYLYGLYPNRDNTPYASAISEALGGNQSQLSNNTVYKLPKSKVYDVENGTMSFWSSSLPLGERINIFNGRYNFFVGLNKIKVKFSKPTNTGIDKFHFDNTITVLSNSSYEAGSLLTFVNPKNSRDVNYLFSATTDDTILNGIAGTCNGSGATTVNINYATSQTTNGSVAYNLPYGSTLDRYYYPQDIEYYQVVTAITVSDASKIWNTTTKQALPDILNSVSFVTSSLENYTLNAADYFEGFKDQVILILQRGVDPYSPKYINEYSIGALFGSNIDDPNFTFTAETRVNIPIQKLDNTGMSVQNFNNQTNFTYQSSFFQPGNDYSAYTTSMIGFYSSLDSNNTFGADVNVEFGTGKVYSQTNNGFYSSTPDSLKYDNSEDLSGVDFMYTPLLTTIPPDYKYYSGTLYPSYTATPFTMIYKNNNIMRTDRLPTSDGLDGGSWSTNPSILQLNNNFYIYDISFGLDSISSTAVAGAEVESQDIEGLPNSINVLSTFDCADMVGLKCYTGFSGNFGVNEECAKSDGVENGCYVFIEKPISTLGKDLKNYSEWCFRFKFMFGLCRGVLSQTFTNNWVNGSLFAFPIQIDVYYGKNNKPRKTNFCKDLIVFDEKTNNFYYRSSPYDDAINKFVGAKFTQTTSLNDKNLLFPTTIINLGFKDYFYNEIIFEPETKSYIMEYLNSTSYGDTSDLVNLFVISRMTDENFLKKLGPAPMDQLFSRGNKGIFNNARRIDADLAQLMSINSEIGVVKFSPEYYSNDGFNDDPIKISGTTTSPTICVFFDSSLDDLQVKDFLTPGRTIFRDENTLQSVFCDYEVNSQLVPFYQWKLNNNSGGNRIIFGNQFNDWSTSFSQSVTTSGIVQKKYQELDRTSINRPTYFTYSNMSLNDTLARGYIFNGDFCVSGTTTGPYSCVDCSGKLIQGTNAGTIVNYRLSSPYYGITPIQNSEISIVFSLDNGTWSDKFIVGAPFHFYFGVVKGASALDKFKTKYSLNE